MIMILFEKHRKNELPTINIDDIIVHANPDSTNFNFPDIKEFYLEDYGRKSKGLEKITLNEIALSINKHTRVDLL